VSELLPRPLRLLFGATSRGVGDRRLRAAVQGKVVLITGASSGVGEAAALRLGRAGAIILLVARREEVLEEVRERISASGAEAHVYPCDLADADAVGALAAEVLERHDRVDVLVSNAGVSIRRWVSQTYDRWRDIERTINVNYLGAVRLMLGLLPSMRERGTGHIVSVGTIGVNFPPLRWSAYIASKAALETWLAGVAPEIRADGIRTTSIQLQLVRSPMLGPFKIWNYLPGMSSEEAASIIARAIVERPREISPAWARIGGGVTWLAGAPLELALASYSAATNPDSRRRGSRFGVLAGPVPVGALASAVRTPARVAQDLLGGAATIIQSGAVRPVRPDRMIRAALAQQRFGSTPAAAAAAALALYGDRPAVIDEVGTVTLHELDADARALASALHHELGVGGEQRVAIMCRNHRGFVQAAVAATRLGCDLLPLNSDFSGRQLADVLKREEVGAVIYDEEFEPVLDDAGADVIRIVAWHDSETRRPTIRALIVAGAEDGEAPAPPRPRRMVTLTSGTTGTPKGAARRLNALVLAPAAVAGLLDLRRIRPVPRSGDPIVVAPPLFHLYGFVGMISGLAFGSPIVIRQRFDPEGTLADVERAGAGVLLAVPTMLKRIMDLPADRRERYDTSSLRMLISGAAPLAPELAAGVMDHFGEILYNGYASTESGSGTFATPRDLRAAPGTVGKPVAGTTIKILGDDGIELPPGETGRIFVRGPLLFEGYTGGGDKERIDGLMATGDVGHFDGHGRLFVDGRDDEMIISGGENVFPQEIEELLLAHEAIADAAVLGVPDEEFGQRLAAFVVLKPGASAGQQELQPYVRERLARYKVPREITVVDELPRTASGKLQRGKLVPAQRS
jgi:acyl-CoA synthetase (AMP-forming)/AMP-acid ligase II/NAD(P)-dependent dehydrogenase (short-subunit alcohol dehydrogenase family)